MRAYFPTPMDRLMAEVIIIGGLPVSRHDAHRLYRAAGYRASDRERMQATAPIAVPGTVAWAYERAAAILLRDAEVAA